MAGEGYGGGNNYDYGGYGGNNFGGGNDFQAYGGGGGGGYGGYGGGGFANPSQPVHVNQYAYGVDDYTAADNNNNNRSRGASNMSRSRGRSKHEAPDNDDAASDDGNGGGPGSEMIDDVPHAYAHNKQMASVMGLDSTREIFKADEEAKIGGKAPNKGLGFLCCIFTTIFLFSLGILITCVNENMITVVGWFGDLKDCTWKYGWNGSIIKTTEREATDKTIDLYPDTFTSRIANDAGNMVLVGILMSCLFVLCGSIILCMRYSSNLPLYSELCCIKVPHRAVLYTILNTIELFTRRITIMYLILGIYGLIEMTYYVSGNCASGECYAFIYPHFGWGILLISTLMISLCGFTEARKLDVKLDEDNLRHFWPQNAQKAQSRNFNFIDLSKLLKSLSNQRKILLNSIILYLLQESGMLTMAIIYRFTNSADEENIDVALLQPHGWNLNEYLDTNNISDYDNNTEAKNWINWGTSLGDIYLVSMVLSCINMFYLWLVLNRYSSFSIIKWIYIIFNILIALAWLGVTIMFYYSYIDYFFNGTGKSDVPTGGDTNDDDTTTTTTDDDDNIVQRFFFPGWGVLILLLNIWYMFQCAYHGYKGL